jgi:hypothetical protein
VVKLYFFETAQDDKESPFRLSKSSPSSGFYRLQATITVCGRTSFHLFTSDTAKVEIIS